MKGLFGRHLDLIGYPVGRTRASISERDVDWRLDVNMICVNERAREMEWKVQKEELCLANIPPSVQMTDLCGELVQWVGIYGVDGEGVVSVDGSETGRDWVLAGFPSSIKWVLVIAPATVTI